MWGETQHGALARLPLYQLPPKGVQSAGKASFLPSVLSDGPGEVRDR